MQLFVFLCVMYVIYDSMIAFISSISVEKQKGLKNVDSYVV